MNRDFIDIKIIDDTSRRDCDIACGTDWSSPDAVELASQQIEARFSGTAFLEYTDLSKTTATDDVTHWSEEIRTKSLSVPLLLINGHLRIAGLFDTRQIIDAIEVEKELGI